MPIARIGALPIHYQRLRARPELVLIHGLMANLAFWYLSVLPELSRRFGVTMYDLRGHGLSGRPYSGYTSGDMVQDLIGLLDYLEIERAHLVGHSFGGAVALHAAVLHPERVQSLVLADARVPSLQKPLATPPRRTWKRVADRVRRLGIDVPEDIPRVAYAFFEELARTEEREFRVTGASDKGRVSFGQAPMNVAVLKQWVKLMRTTTAAGELQAVGTLTPERIGNVRHPTLAIFGEHTNCKPTLRELQRRLPSCRTVIVPRAGHLHPVVRPRVFVAYVDAFLRSRADSVAAHAVTGSRK